MTSSNLQSGARPAIAERITAFIDGRWVQPRGHVLAVIDPATEQPVSLLHESDAAQVDEAVRSAHRSFEQRSWRGMPSAARREIFLKIVDATRDALDELAWLETLNTGLPYGYVRQRQLPRILRNFAFFADTLSQVTEQGGLQDEDYLRFVIREPVGVAALISPWNAPLALASTKIAAELAFGNSCVVKTAEQTPLAVAPSR